ncbi:MAG TPA: M48 family metallopeptidase [Phycisphaerae bacterium]|jgi:Zn-dependent protease with chaperone function
MSAEKSPRSAGAERLFESLDGPIARPRVSIVYLFGLLVVALAMILLPIIYLALIGAAGYALYLHARYDLGILSATMHLHGRTAIVPFLVYLAPLIAGAILLFFMIKPLFARGARELSPLKFDRQQQPLLFEFVDQLCAAIRAPLPRYIKVDCDTNASASFGGGLLGFLRRDMVLTIGLPLAAGLTVRQFAGVLAHELGHFSQGMAMRLTYIIRSVNVWFARLVYERDAFDYMLMDASREGDARIAIVMLVARLFVWITRCILWVLMIIGHGISCFMMRQMEYDADRYDALVAGTDGFEATVQRINVLSVATAATYSQIRDSWSVRRLPDDLPRCILANAAGLSARTGQALRADIEKRRTGVFDTHPSDRDRMRHVQKHPCAGMVRSDRAASTLFKDFETVCRTLSLVFYSDQLGERFQREHLVPTTSMLGEQGEAQEDMAALARYFRPEPRLVRPLLPKSDELPPVSDARKTLAVLKEVHRRLCAAVSKVSVAMDRYDAADAALLEAAHGAALCKAGIRFDPKLLRMDEATPAATERNETAARATQRSLATLLDAYDSALRSRLLAGLGLLGVPAVAARINDVDEWQAEIRKLVRVWFRLRDPVATLAELRRDLGLLSTLLKVHVRDNSNSTVAAMIRTTTARMHGVLSNLRSGLDALEYPFQHSGERLSVGRYLVERLPPEGEPLLVGQAADYAGERLSALYIRLLARLARVAEQVEKVVGLPALPELSSRSAATAASGVASAARESLSA